MIFRIFTFAYPIMPQRELERLQAVHRFLNLEINKEAELQEIVELAKELCQTPAALITLTDGDIHYYAGESATLLDKRACQEIFNTYFTATTGFVMVPDTLQHEQVRGHRYVVGQPLIRFYAGAPLITHDGHTLGTICVLDVKPRILAPAQQHVLKVLAKRVIQFMEFEFSLGILKEQFLEARGAEIKLRSFFESSVACHLLFGMHADVLAFNRNMAELLHKFYDIKLQNGTTAGQILQGEALKDFLDDYARALDGGTSRFEREVKYRNGETIWWDVTFEPAVNEEREIIGVSYNASDITTRKTFELQLLAQNESLKQIAHIQSHELRKPIASILGLMEIFKGAKYSATDEELRLLEQTCLELDAKVRAIVRFAD
jgi:PAS domain S-box-containing protein